MGNRLDGRVVRALRIARGLRVLELADQAGIGRSHLAHIEAGRKQGTIAGPAIASALDVELDVLTGRLPALAALRTAGNLTPERLAAEIGVTPTRLRRIETGIETPEPRLAELIARRLGVDVTVIRPAQDVAA